MAKVVSHLRVGLLAPGIHLEVAFHPAGRTDPVPGVHPHAMITPIHPFRKMLVHAAVVSRLLPVAAVGRHAEVAPSFWGHPPAAIPLPMGMYAQSRTIAAPTAGSWTGVEAKGEVGVVLG